MTDQFNSPPIVNIYYERTYQETILDPDLQPLIMFVQGFFEGWTGNFLHPLGDNLLHSGKLKNSAFYCYLSAQSNVFDWLASSLLCGCYEVVMRELRTILEGLFPAFHLDVAYKELDLEEKLERLRDLEESRVTYGRKAFKLSEVPGWEAYYSLYKELCAYTHLSMLVTGEAITRVSQKGFPETAGARLEVDQFSDCVMKWKDIAKLALVLAESLLDQLDVEYSDMMTLQLD